MSITATGINRYPVKGLNAESLEVSDLSVGEGVPGDRRLALLLGATRFDADRPQWLPKTSFLMLMRNARLAALDTSFDEVPQAVPAARFSDSLAAITAPAPQLGEHSVEILEALGYDAARREGLIESCAVDPSH